MYGYYYYSDIVDMRALGDHIVELSTVVDRELRWLKREAQRLNAVYHFENTNSSEIHSEILN